MCWEYLGDTLAESLHARLFPGSQLLPVASWRYARRRYQLPRLHLGTFSLKYKKGMTSDVYSTTQ